MAADRRYRSEEKNKLDADRTTGLRDVELWRAHQRLTPGALGLFVA